MNIAFKTSFIRDLKKIRNQQIRALIYESIEAAEKCQDKFEIPNIRQIKGVKDHFRIR